MSDSKFKWYKVFRATIRLEKGSVIGLTNAQAKDTPLTI